MNNSQTIVPLTEEDRKLLGKNYFRVWTIYKRMLIGMAVVFGGFWLWIGWETWQNPRQLKETFGIITVVMWVLVVFGLLSTPAYRRKRALPLKKDLEESIKVCVIGRITAIGSDDRYIDKMIFQPQDGSEAKELVITRNVTEASYQAFHLGRDIELEYTPHAQFLLRAALSVPLTSEEVNAYRKAEWVEVAGMLIFLGVLMLGIGWWLGILLLTAILYAISSVLIIGVIVWENRPKA